MIYIRLDKNIKQPDDFFLDDTEGKEYKVECIVKERLNHGEHEFYIRWASYDDSDNTWEPLEYMKDTIALKEWEESQNAAFLTRMNSHLKPKIIQRNMNSDPVNLNDALSSPEKDMWIKAMQEEFESLKANDTWKLVLRPTDRDVIDIRWVFRIKRNLDQSIEKYKGRFVVRGFTQIPGVDYDEVYSPMVSYIANRILIVLAAKYDLIIHQMDVKSVFLNEEVDTELYVEQPEMFEEKDRKLWVCKLKKGLYGLKQAPRLWHRTLQSHLLSIRFTQLESEPSIFIKKLKDTFIVIAAYVDDLQITSNNIKAIQNIKLELQNKFQMTDLR